MFVFILYSIRNIEHAIYFYLNVCIQMLKIKYSYNFSIPDSFNYAIVTDLNNPNQFHKHKKKNSLFKICLTSLKVGSKIQFLSSFILIVHKINILLSYKKCNNYFKAFRNSLAQIVKTHKNENTFLHFAPKYFRNRSE